MARAPAEVTSSVRDIVNGQNRFSPLISIFSTELVGRKTIKLYLSKIISRRINRGIERMRVLLGRRRDVYNQDLKVISFLRLIWFICQEHSIRGKRAHLMETLCCWEITIVVWVTCVACLLCTQGSQAQYVYPIHLILTTTQ